MNLCGFYLFIHIRILDIITINIKNTIMLAYALVIKNR